MSRRTLMTVWIAAVLVLTGCTTVGPRSIRSARFSYNRAIVETRNEQMLTNLVRLRYRDPPYFIEVSSVSTQYVLGAGGSANVGDLGGTAIGSVEGGVNYEERPTITYLPLQGDTFVDRLLSPIPMEVVVLLSHAGWRIDRLLRCCVQRINDVWNAPTASGPTPDRAPNYQRFTELANLMQEVLAEEGIALRYRRADAGEKLDHESIGSPENPFVLTVVFKSDPETVDEVRRIKEILGLRADLDEFYLTSNPTVRSDRQIGILPRSLLGVMSYLSQAVEAPQRDVDAGRVTVTRNRDGTVFDWSNLTRGLFRIATSADPPQNAFVRVRYRDAWFYIDDSDLTSKSTFNLLDQLFQLQAGNSGNAAPMLTLPLN